jgi:hypothetical protein
VPSPLADGDDLAGMSDEDGVVLSAGRYLSPVDDALKIPLGLG